MASSSTAGKIIGAWLPIFIFFALGYEHSIVNMFLIPTGMMLGAKVSIADWWLWNQIPVTLGNIVGGFLFTGLALYLTHGPKAVAFDGDSRIRSIAAILENLQPHLSGERLARCDHAVAGATGGTARVECLHR